jgi:hypothetical protein
MALFFGSASLRVLASRQDTTSDMPRVPYENHIFFLNSTSNDAQVPENTAPPPSPSTSTFALHNATRQPRRRADTMPWSHHTSIFKSHPSQNSLQLKPFPKALPVPHFLQAEHDRREIEMDWEDGLGEMAREQERGQNYYHTS